MAERMMAERETEPGEAPLSFRAAMDEAIGMLGERGLVEVIGLCGYYTLVSMTLNTFEYDLPDGQVSELV